MVLYLIGLGLGDPEDITLRGLSVIKKCSRVYLECYTAIMGIPKHQLQTVLGVTLIEADRDFCEKGIDSLLDQLQQQTQDVAILVVGDPFCATTHSDLFLRAAKRGIPLEILHNASIVSAVAACGLQLYRFGEIVSVPFWSQRQQPDSFYDKLQRNHSTGLHTLLLLDIRVKERSPQNVLKDKPIFQPPRFMSVKECALQLLTAEERRNNGVCLPTARCFGLARMGLKTQVIWADCLLRLSESDLGPPLHSMVLCAPKLHSMEEEMYQHYLRK